MTFYEAIGKLKELYRDQIELEKKISDAQDELKQILNVYNNDNTSLYNEEQGRFGKKIERSLQSNSQP